MHFGFDGAILLYLLLDKRSCCKRCVMSDQQHRLYKPTFVELLKDLRQTMDIVDLTRPGASLRRLTLTCLPILACLTILLLLFQTRVSGESVDMAGHYVLVTYFTDDIWRLFHRVVLPINPGMQGYPPLSHMFAAIISKIGILPFLAMHYVSMASIFFIYVFCFIGVQVRSKSASTSTAIVLLILIFAASSTRALFGHELVGNFFYAHVVGEAVFLAVLYAAIKLSSYRLSFVAAPIVVFVLGWLFPITQVKVAVAFLILGLLQVIHVLPFQSLRKAALGYLCWATIVLAAVVAHPSFAYMRSVATNEGGTDQTISLVVLGVIVAALTLLSILSAARARYENQTIPLLALAGMATAFTCIAQASAYIAGSGSVYGIRKHAYAALTILIFLVVREILRLLLPSPSFYGRRRQHWQIASIAALAATTLVIYPAAQDRWQFLSFQTDVRATARFDPSSFISKSVSLNKDLPPSYNMMVTHGDLKLASDLTLKEHGRVYDAFLKEKNVNESIYYAFISRKYNIPPSCIRPDVIMAWSYVAFFRQCAAATTQ
jgi:hypothetical protein